MKKHTITNDQWDALIEEYTNGKSGTYVCKKYGITYNTLKNEFKTRGIERRATKYGGRKSTNTYNKKFFSSIENEKQAYWLGFIYADGYISGDSIFGISLSTDDREHLEKLKRDIKATHNIKDYESETAYGLAKYSRFLITDKELVNQLINLGVVHNKTNILMFPKFIDEDLVRHFIRGYFDGDGSLIGGITPRISFLGTEDMLEDIRKRLPIETDVKLTTRKAGQTVKELKFGGNIKVKKFLEWLYKDATIYLERKYVKYRKIYG
jgi:intein/homing endonuclease